LAIFYGWWVVIAVFVVALYVSGVIYWGFTAVIQPIAQDTGWSFTQISLAASLRGLETSLLAPFVGALADRYGSRKLILLGALVGASGFMLVVRSQSLLTFYVAFFIVSIGLGACTTTVLLTAVANCFKKRVGLASGIAIAGFGFGGIMVSPMVRLIERYGWRTTVELIAAGMVVFIVPLAFVIKHEPEQHGHMADAPSDRETIHPETCASESDDVSLGQAMRSNRFWRIALGLFCQPLLTSAAVTHVIPYLTNAGIAKYTAGIVASTLPLVSIAGRLGLGWLADKIDKRKAAAGALAAMGVGMVFFANATKTAMFPLILFLVLFGVGFGGCISIRVPLLHEYFGSSHFGAVFGFLMAICHAGAIVGPSLAGLAHDFWSYRGFWLVLSVLPVVAMTSILSVSPVHRS
jgi:MFS family permease